jgi:hypothetical protein
MRGHCVRSRCLGRAAQQARQRQCQQRDRRQPQHAEHADRLISFCASGANTNCPNEPPALMTPAAVPREAAGTRCAAAPISTEKLPAPEPAAISTPRVSTMPRPLSM